MKWQRIVSLEDIGFDSSHAINLKAGSQRGELAQSFVRREHLLLQGFRVCGGRREVLY